MSPRAAGASRVARAAADVGRGGRRASTARRPSCDALQARGERIDACIVGEPTSTERFGDTIKNGRRGSLNGVLRVHGRAVPHRVSGARPQPDSRRALPALAELVADRVGSRQRVLPADQLSDLEHPCRHRRQQHHSGTLDVLFNFRFSPESSAAGAAGARARRCSTRIGSQYELAVDAVGEPFLTPRGALVDALSAAVRVGHRRPSRRSRRAAARPTAASSRRSRARSSSSDRSTTSIHKIDEHVRIADIAPLSAIYERTVTSLFDSPYVRR